MFLQFLLCCARKLSFRCLSIRLTLSQRFVWQAPLFVSFQQQLLLLLFLLLRPLRLLVTLHTLLTLVLSMLLRSAIGIAGSVDTLFAHRNRGSGGRSSCNTKRTNLFSQCFVVGYPQAHTPESPHRMDHKGRNDFHASAAHSIVSSVCGRWALDDQLSNINDNINDNRSAPCNVEGWSTDACRATAKPAWKRSHDADKSCARARSSSSSFHSLACYFIRTCKPLTSLKSSKYSVSFVATASVSAASRPPRSFKHKRSTLQRF